MRYYILPLFYRSLCNDLAGDEFVCIHIVKQVDPYVPRTVHYNCVHIFGVIKDFLCHKTFFSHLYNKKIKNKNTQQKAIYQNQLALVHITKVNKKKLKKIKTGGRGVK